MHQVHEPSDDVRSCIIITVLWSLSCSVQTLNGPQMCLMLCKSLPTGGRGGWVTCLQPPVNITSCQTTTNTSHIWPLNTGFSSLSEGVEDIMDCWCWAFCMILSPVSSKPADMGSFPIQCMWGSQHFLSLLSPLSQLGWNLLLKSNSAFVKK